MGDNLAWDTGAAKRSRNRRFWPSRSAKTTPKNIFAGEPHTLYTSLSYILGYCAYLNSGWRHKGSKNASYPNPRLHNYALRCPMPDHPPCQIIPHPLAQSASAPGSCKIFYDSLFSTLRLAALIEWETEIRQAGEAVLFYLENDENNALRFSHGFAVDFETLK